MGAEPQLPEAIEEPETPAAGSQNPQRSKILQLFFENNNLILALVW